MLAPLLIGSAMVVANMAIQIAVLLFVIGLLFREASERPIPHGWAGQTRILGWVVLLLFLGHVLQFATWAALFFYLGEFSDYATAFYHSAVNFTSLGYGDIVMSERWRLLGALEAANGVLMFGLSAGAILSVMTRMLNAERPTSTRVTTQELTDRKQTCMSNWPSWRSSSSSTASSRRAWNARSTPAR
jgi:hypothetical protein